MADATIQVTVAYAGVAQQYVRELHVVRGATVATAIVLSGIAEIVGLDSAGLQHIGIFGRAVEPTTVLRDGDRIEIYRQLKVDPKEARRRRAQK